MEGMDLIPVQQQRQTLEAVEAVAIHHQVQAVQVS